MIGATINQTGAFRFRATRVGRDTMLAQIVRLVEQAQGSKAPIQRLADLVASYFVPAVIFIAIVTFVVWFDFGPAPALTFALVAAVAVLIIACPCALGPGDAVVDHGRRPGKGAENGVLIRSAEALGDRAQARARSSSTRPGTHHPREAGAHRRRRRRPGSTEDELLRLAAAAERSSEHPLGRGDRGRAPRNAGWPSPEAERRSSR